MIRDIDEIDPAEAATSPGHGSNNPAQDKAVNRQQATTATGLRTRAPIDYERAFHELADPIADAVDRMNVLCVLTDAVQGSAYRGDGGDARVIFMRHEVNALHHMIEDVRTAIDAVNDRWNTPLPNSVKENFGDLDEQSQIDTLIGSHRNAARELEAAIIEGQKIRAVCEETERYKIADAEEERTFDSLLKWRPKTVRGSGQRLQYLFGDKGSPWADSVPGEAKLQMLFASMSDVS